VASFFVFKIRASCLECGENLAFEGPAIAVPCRACGSTLDVGAATWKDVFGLREGTASGQAVASPAATRPVSFACPDCGANLKIAADAPRILACSFCKADLFLPDPLWRALHPVKKRVPWVVAFR
jgi:ribosomal protein S27E